MTFFVSVPLLVEENLQLIKRAIRLTAISNMTMTDHGMQEISLFVLGNLERINNCFCALSTYILSKLNRCDITADKFAFLRQLSLQFFTDNELLDSWVSIKEIDSMIETTPITEENANLFLMAHAIFAKNKQYLNLSKLMRMYKFSEMLKLKILVAQMQTFWQKYKSYLPENIPEDSKIVTYSRAATVFDIAQGDTSFDEDTRFIRDEQHGGFYFNTRQRAASLSNTEFVTPLMKQILEGAREDLNGVPVGFIHQFVALLNGFDGVTAGDDDF